MKTSYLLTIAAFCASIGQAGLIFDNSSQQNNQSNRVAASSPLALVTVSSAVTINQIGAKVDLNSAGDLEFLIFNNSTAALLFESTSQAFVDDGDTFKVSAVFPDFILQPGTTYAIGAISDVGGLWGYANTASAFTQNNITVSNITNANVSNYASPAFGVGGGAMIILELFSGPASSVPEPASVGFVGLGLGALILAAKRFGKLPSISSGTK